MLTGFCFLGECFKYLECQPEKAANRYDASLVDPHSLTGGVFVFQNTLIILRRIKISYWLRLVGVFVILARTPYPWEK